MSGWWNSGITGLAARLSLLQPYFFVNIAHGALPRTFARAVAGVCGGITLRSFGCRALNTVVPVLADSDQV